MKKDYARLKKEYLDWYPAEGNEAGFE
jgi:hypothetical protein